MDGGHLRDDLAVQLETYILGLTSDLDREKITKLADHLDFPFNWGLAGKAEMLPSRLPGQLPATPMQAQAAALLDTYSLHATLYVLERVRRFANENGKQLLVVLFDPYRAMEEMRLYHTRYDQIIVDYLLKERVAYFDMNEVHLQDFKQYNLTWQEYKKLYFIGHYNPRGNHFFAHSIKDHLVTMLDPRPVPYQRPDQRAVTFKGYLQGYQ